MRPTAVPLPPRTNRNAEEHRRQLADYARWQGETLSQMISIRAQSIVRLGTNFNPGVPLTWVKMTGWNLLVEESFAPIWDDTNQRFDFAEVAASLQPTIFDTFWVRMTVQLEVENTANQNMAAAVGIGQGGLDPESAPNLAVYDTRVVARRQDFNFATLATPLSPYIEQPDFIELWMVEQAAGDIDAIAGTGSWATCEVFV